MRVVWLCLLSQGSAVTRLVGCAEVTGTSRVCSHPSRSVRCHLGLGNLGGNVACFGATSYLLTPPCSQYVTGSTLLTYPPHQHTRVTDVTVAHEPASRGRFSLRSRLPSIHLPTVPRGRRSRTCPSPAQHCAPCEPCHTLHTSISLPSPCAVQSPPLRPSPPPLRRCAPLVPTPPHQRCASAHPPPQPPPHRHQAGPPWPCAAPHTTIGADDIRALACVKGVGPKTINWLLQLHTSGECDYLAELRRRACE